MCIFLCLSLGIEWFLDIIFIVDIPLNFLTNYVDANDVTINSQSTIIHNYVSGFFFIDVISSVPLERMGVGAIGSLSKVAKAFRIMKFAKMLRISKLGRLIPQVQSQLEIRNSTLAIIKFCFIIFFSAHWLGSAYFILARAQDFSEESWVNQYFLGITGEPYNDDTFPVSTKYITSFYWALTTMSTIGYGDITPKTDAERVFVTFSMCIGAGIFAYGITNMCTLVFNFNVRQVKFHDLQDNLKSYMDRHHIRKELIDRVKKYMFYRQFKSSVDVFGEESLLTYLSPSLRREITLEFIKTLVLHVPLLHNLTYLDGAGDKFILEIAAVLKGHAFPSGEVLAVEGQEVDAVSFISQGDVQVSCNIQVLSGFDSLVPTAKEHALLAKGRSCPTPLVHPRRYAVPEYFEDGVGYVFPHVAHLYGSGSKPGHGNGGVAELKTHEIIFSLGPGCSFNETACILGAKSSLAAVSLSHCDVYTVTFADLKQKLFASLNATSGEPLSIAKTIVLEHFRNHGRDFALPPEWVPADYVLQEVDEEGNEIARAEKYFVEGGDGNDGDSNANITQGALTIHGESGDLARESIMDSTRGGKPPHLHDLKMQPIPQPSKSLRNLARSYWAQNVDSRAQAGGPKSESDGKSLSTQEEGKLDSTRGVEIITPTGFVVAQVVEEKDLIGATRAGRKASGPNSTHTGKTGDTNANDGGGGSARMGALEQRVSDTEEALRQIQQSVVELTQLVLQTNEILQRRKKQ